MARLLFLRWALWSSGLLLGLGGCEWGSPVTRQTAARAMPPSKQLRQGFKICGSAESESATLADIQEAVVLPLGTPMPPENSQVVVQFALDYMGRVEGMKIAQGISPAVNSAVLAAVRSYQPHFCPLNPDDSNHPRPGTVAWPLTIRLPGAATPAQRREADTRGYQTARRRPGEADSTFVRRVFPLSYDSTSRALLTRAWRPSAFGKQLFFTRPSCTGYCGYSTLLLVLDPYQKNTYAVQEFVIPSQGDDTTLADLFLADVDHDGRQELLAIGECCLRENNGCYNHYQTQIWQYLGPDRTGRPRYQADETERPYLDDLPTAAAVRRALARHQRRLVALPPASAAADTTKKAGAASPQEGDPGQ
jgi:hypothetical protein